MRPVPSIILVVPLALGLAGCEPADTPPVRVDPSADAAPPSLWEDHADALVVRVVEEGPDEAMEAAIAEARATAEDARRRWSMADATDRRRWAIKWQAATTEDGRFEHVWVQPVHWSAFRIEGVLVTEPVGELAAGRTGGDLVGFPVEELVDWLHLDTDDPLGPREGGYTVDVLEARFGRPTGAGGGR